MTLDKNVADILRDSVELARTVQPFITKQAELQAACDNRAEELVDNLIRNGVVSFEKRSHMIEELRDPVKAYDYIEKLANRIGPDNLAEPGDKTEVSETAEEKLLNWLRY